MRRATVVSAGGFDETLPYSEDWDLWLRLSRSSRFALLRWPAVLYRQHAVQGSRKARNVDYRVSLLGRNARLFGLASRDGRSVPLRQFRRQLSRFRFEFGYHHLLCGDRWIGVKALAGAWRLRPSKTRSLLLAVAGLLGWRPRE